MTTATTTTNDTQALINALQAQIAELSKKLEVQPTAKPVGKLEKLEQPLAVHSESEHIQALKEGTKAKKGRESKRDVKPGSKGFQEPKKPRKKVEIREQLINDVLNGRDRFGLLTYREAQKLCGIVGLKASGSHDALTQRWSAYVKKETTSDMLRSQPKKRDYDGLSYRQAQRLVKWCKESFTYSQLAKLKLKKNVGWSRVEENCDILLGCEAFWNYMNNGYDKELNEFLGTEFIVNADDENSKF